MLIRSHVELWYQVYYDMMAEQRLALQQVKIAIGVGLALWGITDN